MKQLEKIEARLLRVKKRTDNLVLGKEKNKNGEDFKNPELIYKGLNTITRNLIRDKRKLILVMEEE